MAAQMECRPFPMVSNDNLASEDREQGRESLPLIPPRKPRLSELFASSADVGACGFALAQVPRGGRLLWVQERMAMQEAGRPASAAFRRFGGDPERLVLACAANAGDLLWTLEEALKCASLSAIIGEVWGDPRALGFTATKRLAFRAERQGINLFLIRFGGTAGLSAARERWRIASLPSAPHMWDENAPGAPRWRAELFRVQGRAPGVWEARYDAPAHRLHLDAALSDGALAASAESGIAAAGARVRRHPGIEGRAAAGRTAA